MHWTKKFEKQPVLKKEYVKFIREYQNLKHVKIISEESCKIPGFWLPHHAVFKNDSLTTKVRVVFDASAKSTSNVSLNDILMVGPTIQEADVANTYLQILIDESETQYQRILWRENPTNELRAYELKSVTNGTASAAFLAIRCLHQLADDAKFTHDTASKV